MNKWQQYSRINIAEFWKTFISHRPLSILNRLKEPKYVYANWIISLTPQQWTATQYRGRGPVVMRSVTRLGELWGTFFMWIVICQDITTWPKSRNNLNNSFKPRYYQHPDYSKCWKCNMFPDTSLVYQQPSTGAANLGSHVTWERGLRRDIKSPFDTLGVNF